MILYGFVFQAEDGIRDLVRSRGLGDVYKRQVEEGARFQFLAMPVEVLGDSAGHVRAVRCLRTESVSYTHLTLPTSDLV